jgi:hypothetical protein
MDGRSTSLPVSLRLMLLRGAHGDVRAAVAAIRPSPYRFWECPLSMLRETRRIVS